MNSEEQFNLPPKNGQKGITWDYYKRERFGGMNITPQNRRTILNSFIQDYLYHNKERLDNGTIDEKSLLKEAEAYGKEHINYNNKMMRAHSKGKLYFRWKGIKEPVRTLESLSRWKSYLENLESRAIESKNNREEEE